MQQRRRAARQRPPRPPLRRTPRLAPAPPLLHPPSILLLLSISSPALLPSPPVAHAAVLSRDVLRWSYHRTALPRPMSDMSSTYGLAPNDDGDLVVSMYLLGGCVDHYVRKPGSPSEYYCPDVSDGTTAFDPSFDLFEPRRKMPRRRYRHGAVAAGGAVWVVGGRDEKDGVVAEVDVYDPARDKWITVGSLPPDLAVSDHAVWYHRDFLYVAGGYDRGYRAVPTTLAIDVDATLRAHGGFDSDGGGQSAGAEVAYERLADMGEARGDARALAYGRYGYVAGGFTHEDGYCRPLASVEVYDPRHDGWVRAGDLGVGRADAAVMKLGGRFYALGGETRVADGDGNEVDGGDCGGDVDSNVRLPRRRTYPVDSVEVYDPLNGLEGRWQSVKAVLPDDRRYRFALAPWPAADVIYIFGGVKNVYNDTAAAPGEAEEDGGCTDCLQLSDIIVEYTHDLEKYYIPDAWMGPAAVALLIGCVACVVGRLGWRAWKRRKEFEDRRRMIEACADDGGGAIGLVDMYLRGGGEPFRDAEAL